MNDVKALQRRCLGANLVNTRAAIQTLVLIFKRLFNSCLIAV
jgi:hypothetical protein